MDLAVCGGMKNEQARKYKERQKRIYRLMDKIAALTKLSKDKPERDIPE